MLCATHFCPFPTTLRLCVTFFSRPWVWRGLVLEFQFLTWADIVATDNGRRRTADDGRAFNGYTYIYIYMYIYMYIYIEVHIVPKLERQSVPTTGFFPDVHSNILEDSSIYRSKNYLSRQASATKEQLPNKQQRIRNGFRILFLFWEAAFWNIYTRIYIYIYILPSQMRYKMFQK